MKRLLLTLLYWLVTVLFYVVMVAAIPFDWVAEKVEELCWCIDCLRANLKQKARP